MSRLSPLALIPLACVFTLGAAASRALGDLPPPKGAPAPAAPAAPAAPQAPAASRSGRSASRTRRRSRSRPTARSASTRGSRSPSRTTLQPSPTSTVVAQVDGKDVPVEVRRRTRRTATAWSTWASTRRRATLTLRWTATITRKARRGPGHGPRPRPLQAGGPPRPDRRARRRSSRRSSASTSRTSTSATARRSSTTTCCTTMQYDKVAPGWGKGDFDRACEVGKGNCTDFHAKFTGIGRAAGIPVRFTMGIPMTHRREAAPPAATTAGRTSTTASHWIARRHLRGAEGPRRRTRRRPSGSSATSTPTASR